MTAETATIRYGHGMLPRHPQMECVECGNWSYLAYRSEGPAGRCYGCWSATRSDTEQAR